MRPVIAILGWGSLIWDKHPDFSRHHRVWQFDGPLLPIEFSRISKTRAGALTLVVDSSFGSHCKTAFAISKRADPEDAICDLRTREGTTKKNIGFLFVDGSAHQTRDAAIGTTIETWAKQRSIDVVVWTDLQSNFEKTAGQPFSVPAAISYLASLPESGKFYAAEYIGKAPDFVVTPLRSELLTHSWFKTT